MDTKSLAEAKCVDTIRGRLLIEGGNYSRKYGMWLFVSMGLSRRVNGVEGGAHFLPAQ